MKKLSERVRVEPLDDERWTNIERAVVSGASDAAAVGDARRLRSRWGVALAFGAAMLAVVIAAGLVGWKLRASDEPTGAVAVAPSVADPATPLAIDTTERGSTLDIGDATIVSDPATAYVVTRPGSGVLVTMRKGKVELTVGKRGDRAPLVVRAGDTDVVVIGTRFSVDFGDGTGGVDVRVTEGVVKIVRARHEARVAAGQAWSTNVGTVATAALTTSSAARPAGEVPIDDAVPEVLHDRVAAVPKDALPTGSASRPRPGAGGPTLSTRPSTNRGTASDSTSLDVPTLIKRQPLLPPLVLDGVGTDAASSVARYREIVVKEKGDRASHAFYSIAYVQALKLGRDSDAISTLDAYVRRFTGGKEYQAALWLRVRILCLRSIDDRCRQAAYTYAHGTTNASARSVAELITTVSR